MPASERFPWKGELIWGCVSDTKAKEVLVMQVLIERVWKIKCCEKGGVGVKNVRGVTSVLDELPDPLGAEQRRGGRKWLSLDGPNTAEDTGARITASGCDVTVTRAMCAPSRHNSTDPGLSRRKDAGCQVPRAAVRTKA